MSEIVSTIEYISLETTQESFIGSVDKVLIHRNGIIVIDERFQSIFVFSPSGKFLRKIGNIGKGPGEYIGISDVAIRHRDSLISIFDDQQVKIISYSMQGKLIDDVQAPFNADKLVFLNDSILSSLGPRPIYVYNQFYNIALLDDKFKVKNRIISRKYENLTTQTARDMPTTSMCQLQLWNDTLSYWETKYDTIYRIVNQTTAFPRYAIICKNKLSADMNITTRSTNNQVLISRVCETKKYFFFEVVNEGQIHRILYNKDKNSLMNVYSDFHDYELSRRIVDDMDGGMPFWPKGVLDDGRVYDIFYLQTLKDSKDNYEFSSINSDIKYQASELKVLVSKSEFIDNPCLRIIKLK